MKRTTTFFAMLFMFAFIIPAHSSEGIEFRNGNDNSLPSILKKGKKGGRGSDGIKGKMIFTLGLGFNTTPSVTAVRYASSSDTANHGYRSVLSFSSFAPIYNMMFDYGIADRFTVGLGFGYQSFNIVWGDPNVSFVDTWKRIAISARADYRIIASETIGLYTGLRVGYNMYTLTSTASNYDKSYVDRNTVHPQAVAFQAHFGFSYYFSGMVGANVEVGLAVGGPYYSAVGLTIKF
jgi:hypothetical protein